jgi:hypothetical protein
LLIIQGFTLYQIGSFTRYKIGEQRKHVRINKPYFIILQVRRNENMIFQGWDIINLTNLSAAGMFFYARKNFAVDTVLNLKIGFPLLAPVLICNGRVIRAKRHLDSTIIGFGVRFTEIHEQILEVIKKIYMFSKKKCDNCQLFNTDDCPNNKDKFMKRFIHDFSIGRRYLPTFDKKKEAEINNRFAHNCDSFKPF